MSTNDETVIGSNNGTPDGMMKEEPQVGAAPAPLGFSIDDIMWRVRAEVTRRRNGQINGVTFPPVPSEVRSFDLSVPHWKPAVPRLPVKDSYHLAELLAYSDADFIDVVYHAILRRPPDEYGFNLFLRILRSGASTKTEILMDILASPESKAAGVRVEGLYLPALLERWRRRKLIGPIIAWVHALIRLGKQSDRQSNLHAIQAREVQELGRLVNEASEYLLQRIYALKVEFSGGVRAPEFEEFKREYAAASAHAASAISQLNNDVRSRFQDVLTRFQACDEHINRLRVSFASTSGSIEQLLTREEQGKGGALGALDPFYAAFEDHFRGDRSLIRIRVEPYLALMREAGAGTPEAPILDIGCGRGEWLELLRDSGLIGRGIEINRVFIDGCRALGLEVLEGDAIGTLRAMPDCSVGAATAIHVIEHLPFERAIAMLDELRRVLRPDGLLIVETPNPENLTVGHHWFYMDPTHRNPLPPQALRWIVESRGFHDVRIERLVLARDQKVPSLLPAYFPGADAVNALIASASASLDYAIVGKRQ